RFCRPAARAGTDRRSGHRRHAARGCRLRSGHRDGSRAAHRSLHAQLMPVALRNIGVLATCRPGAPQSDVHAIARAALVWNGPLIAWAGPERDLPEAYRAAEAEDAGGRLAVPGLVDCHTHLAFGGWRADEFTERALGRTYSRIAEAGGGNA